MRALSFYRDSAIIGRNPTLSMPSPRTKVIPMKQVPANFSVLRYVIYRRTITEKVDFLIDFWGGKATFDENPIKAKITGYSWLTKEEAEMKLGDVKRLYPGEEIDVVRLRFDKDERGGWVIGDSLLSSL